MLPNGSFETGAFAPWNANGATLTGQGARTGTWAARVTRNSLETTVPTVVGAATLARPAAPRRCA